MRMWNSIVRQLQAPALMERMFALFQVGDAIGRLGDIRAARTVRAASLRCIGCSHTRECANWLSEQSNPEGPPSYCRNAELIAQHRERGIVH